jgi:hypothetical protein
VDPYDRLWPKRSPSNLEAKSFKRGGKEISIFHHHVLPLARDEIGNNGLGLPDSSRRLEIDDDRRLQVIR